MDQNQNMDYALDWDSEISKESEFELLPEGDYSFLVEALERGRFDGSEKMSACPSAKLTLVVKNKDGRDVRVFDDLRLHSKMEWKLSEFFTAIGQKKKGEPLRMNWGAVPGAKGRCKITINKYTTKDGQQRENNRVTKYYAPEPKSFTAGQF